MFNFPAIYIANGTAIMLLLIILLSSKKPFRHWLFEEKIFYSMVIINIMQCLLETAAFVVDGNLAYGYRTFSIIVNTMLFINTVMFAYSWVVYVDYKLLTDMKRIRRRYPFVAIPAALIVIGCFINLVTPVFFVIDQHNIYQRTDFFIIPYAVTYFYLVYGMVLIYSHRKNVHKYLFFPATLFMLPIGIASVLQFFFYGYSLIWLGVSVGMISLFVNVQNEASYVDQLSGLFNRQYLKNMMLMHTSRGDSARTLAGLMVDIDGFKSINDNFGHLVGDDAITSTGKILRTAVGDKGMLGRMAGDEFILLMYINSQTEITDMIDVINTHTALFNETEEKPYKIHFSIGYSTYDSKRDSMDDFLRRIDNSMYEDKRRKLCEGIVPDRRGK